MLLRVMPDCLAMARMEASLNPFFRNSHRAACRMVRRMFIFCTCMVTLTPSDSSIPILYFNSLYFLFQKSDKLLFFFSRDKGNIPHRGDIARRTGRYGVIQAIEPAVPFDQQGYQLRIGSRDFVNGCIFVYCHIASSILFTRMCRRQCIPSQIGFKRCAEMAFA